MAFEMMMEELAHDTERVSSLVSGLSMAEARVRPDPDSWSVLEVVCHLLDEEREDFRPRLDIALHRPDDRWAPIDPVGWVSARRYNEQDLAERLALFVDERVRSVAWLNGLVAPDWDAAYEAPFGPIRAGDLLASWVAHDNLHLRQLVELQRARVVAIADPYSVRYAGDW